MKKLKSFFKKHYKRFVVVSITALMCFSFLFCSVSADEYNPGYNDFTIYDCKMINFSSSEDGLIEEPSKYADFQWSINKYTQLYQYQRVVMTFTCSEYLQCYSSGYKISIPFAFIPTSKSVSTSNRVTSCIVEFESNGVKNITQVDLTYGNQFGRNCFFADAIIDVVVPNDVSVLFDTFTLTFYSFEGYFTGDLFSFGFYKSLSASGVGSASFPNDDVNNSISKEHELLESVTNESKESINIVFSNPVTIIPQGVLHSFMAITSLWKNFLGRTPFSYLFNFSLSLGMFGFVVGMGSIIVGAVSRSNNRSNNHSNNRRKK